MLGLPFLSFSDLGLKRKRAELGLSGDVDWPAAVSAGGLWKEKDFR